jgi:protein-S-isoprenylcysteine O-methyltransferase Ste14
MTLELWAMVENPFFSPEIRLQSERGHKLVACGPYRLMRHPGYLAMMIAIPSSALAIGSWLALAPAAAFCRTIWKRVGQEEEFLLENLAGYPDYLGKVGGRLLPRMEFRRHPRGNPASDLPSHPPDGSPQ